MSGYSSSLRLANVMRDELIDEAKRLARDGEDIRVGTEAFWKMFSDHMIRVSELLDELHEEVINEVEASGNDLRFCDCGNQIYKKHKRGRWPVYCDDCN